MEDKAWAKTLLEIYRYLETICSTIDDLVKRTSMQGYGFSNNTKFSAEKIIELTYKKQKLINIKVLIEDSLASLNTNDIKILTLFYIDGISAKNLTKIYNISMRTFFRRKSVALSHLYLKFKEFGFDKEKLRQFLDSEHWIMNIYESNYSFLSSKQEKEVHLEDILRKAVFELKNFSKQKYAYGY